uniref:GDP-mannose 4,6-dehydratase n=1 Tax=Castellaniella defragrans TaxID=75697 RepID=UPI003341AA00
MSGYGNTVLVTGDDGFTGCYMRKELESSGYRVVGLTAHAPSGRDRVQVNLLNEGALEQAVRQIAPDMVVHLAAMAFVGHGNANAFYHVNLLGTRNLLQALVRLPRLPKAILLASSANVYGNASEGMIDETVVPAPANDYAVSKLAMEYMAKLYADKLPIIITRPFNYTGVGQAESFLIPKIVSHFRKKAVSIELGNIQVYRDFGDVRMVVRAYKELLERSNAIGQTVNISTGLAHSLHEVLGMCQDITGHRLDIEINPDFIRKNEVKMLCGSSERLRRLIGNWQPPLLHDTLRWMLDRG